MKTSILYCITFIVLIGFLSVNSVFADNVTGYFQENFQGSNYAGYIPEDCAKAENMSLVVGLHGAGGTAQSIMSVWKKVASEYKFAVISIKSKGNAWDIKAEQSFVKAAIEDFKRHCSYDTKHILLTGFSGGANMALHMAVKYKYTAFAGVGAGCILDHLSKAELKASSKLPVYYLSGSNDPNLKAINLIKGKLEGYGYKVKQDIFPGLEHEYPNEASERIWKWFDNIGPMHRIEKYKTNADKAFEEKNIAIAYDMYYKVLTECASLPSKLRKENKKKIDEYKKLAEEKLKTLEKIWVEKEPEVFKIVEKCYKYIEKKNHYDAAKNFVKILEDYPDSKAAELAKVKLEEILSAHMDVADKIAGSDPKNDLKKAEKTLNKASLTHEEKDEVIKQLKELIAKYPHTSYAIEAQKLIDRFTN